MFARTLYGGCSDYDVKTDLFSDTNIIKTLNTN